MFQGLPGPVGDPGPKGSRVSGPWQVPWSWGPGWALPVPPVGWREIGAGSPPPIVRRETTAKTLPPELSLETEGQQKGRVIGTQESSSIPMAGQSGQQRVC